MFSEIYLYVFGHIDDEVALVLINFLIFPLGVLLWFKCVIFKYFVVLTFMRISNVAAFSWMKQAPNDDMSTLVQVIAWCQQVTRH